MARNKNVLILVVAAVVLFGLAFLLSRGSSSTAAADAGPAPGPKKKAAAVVYPRDKLRLTQPAAQRGKPSLSMGNEPALDAMQRALIAPDSKGAVFVEANAIRHAPLMEKMLKCRHGENADGLDEMKKKLGIDPMEDVDRIGFDGDVFVASGFFSKMTVPPELGQPTAYGDKGKIWSAKGDDGESMYFGQDGDGLLMSGADEGKMKAALDRAEGRGPPATALPAGFGEGEVYGTVGAAFIQSMIGNEQDPTVQSIAKLVTSSTVRMDVDEDAALSLDLQAVDDKSSKDLADAVKGAFAGLHAKAVNDGDTELASLLDQARVSPGEGGRFNVDVAVPGDTLLKALGCKPDGTPLEGAPKPGRKPSPPAPTP